MIKLLKCIILEVFFMIIILFFLVFYGPFHNIRDVVIKSLMTTMNHKWIAELFLSNKKIDQIMNKQIVKDISQSGKCRLERDINISNNENGIELYEIKGNRFKGKIILVYNPRRVKVGYTSKIGKEGQTTSEIAKRYNAIAAINGGGFKGSNDGIAWAGTGETPRGILMSDGKLIYNDIKDKYKKSDVMALTKEGYLLVGKYSLNQLVKLKASEVISFGPPLIVNGRKTIENGDGGWGIAPRTAIGQRKDGVIILLAIDGRRVNCLGATLKEVQDILFDFGAYNAVNLDGGFSTTMYYNGKVINNPPDILGERCVPTIVYVEK